MIAVLEGRVEICTALFAAGANLFVQNKYEKTALQLATGEMKLLLVVLALPPSSAEMGKALLSAASSGFEYVMRVLLSMNVDTTITGPAHDVEALAEISLAENIGTAQDAPAVLLPRVHSSTLQVVGDSHSERSIVLRSVSLMAEEGKYFYEVKQMTDTGVAQVAFLFFFVLFYFIIFSFNFYF
jgi:hypothetical protein